PLPKDSLPAELPLDAVLLGLAENDPPPTENELTPQRVRLGRKLFFDPLLSADGTVACASCHDPQHGFANDSPRAVGIHGQVGSRNAPSLLNRAYGTSFFWDGRAATLEAQALEPIANPLELGSHVSDVVDKLAADARYREAFAAAYEGDVTAENLARALAAFERVLLSGDSAVDRFQAGDASALTDTQRHGLWLFESRGRCWRCHRGPNYSDEEFHNTGVAALQATPDRGRHAVTGDESDQGRFKTPSLRDVSRTGPYMHDGSLATLRDVVDFYNRGGGKNPRLDAVITPLGLSEDDVESLVEFLKALDGRPWSGQ
ncbi:MAG TPA: cytochrome c peroxidase, partial [Pirellulales bacterium]|nr:cytochrome c peroxidase [Pirellulales bacterium]